MRKEGKEACKTREEIKKYKRKKEAGARETRKIAKKENYTVRSKRKRTEKNSVKRRGKKGEYKNDR